VSAPAVLKLSNGMHVILHPDRSAPLVHLNLRFGVGSKHESPGARLELREVKLSCELYVELQ
jgi:predicted Zn-dependent peptidase